MPLVMHNFLSLSDHTASLSHSVILSVSLSSLLPVVFFCYLLFLLIEMKTDNGKGVKTHNRILQFTIWWGYLRCLFREANMKNQTIIIGLIFLLAVNFAWIDWIWSAFFHNFFVFFSLLFKLIYGHVERENRQGNILHLNTNRQRHAE